MKLHRFLPLYHFQADWCREHWRDLDVCNSGGAIYREIELEGQYMEGSKNPLVLRLPL